MDLRPSARQLLATTAAPAALTLAVVTLCAASARAQNDEWFDEPDERGWPVLAEWGWTNGRADGRAPFGVGLDDGVGVGDLRLAYRYFATRFEGVMDGTSDLSTQQVFDRGFTISPLSMTSATHHFSLRYGLSEDYTLAASLPFYDRTLDAVQQDPGSGGQGETFNLDSSGNGDLRFGTLYLIDSWGREKAYFTLFGSWPIGSFDQRGNIPGQGSGSVLPFALQLGTGTVDVTPGLVLLGQAERHSWGLGIDNTFRLTETDQDYRLGGRSEATGWLAWQLGSLAPSARLNFVRQGNAHGTDTRLDPTFASANSRHLAHRRLDLLLGLAFAPGGTGPRAGFEFGVPLYQSLDGPQLGVEFYVSFGVQFGF